MIPPAPGASSSPRAASASFRVADILVRYQAVDPGLRFVVRDSIRPFIIETTAEPDCVLRCDVGPVDPTPAPLMFSAPVWDIRRLDGGEEEIIFRSEGPWARLRMNDGFTRGQLTHSEERSEPSVIYPGDYPIAEYVICRLMGKRGGLHLHASAVRFDGGAYVFIGHSGAGKSTLAGIAELAGGEVLSDDRTIITITEDGAVAWGTPWHGSLQRTSAMSAPILGLAMLVQSDRDALSEIPRDVALKEIFVRLIQPRLDAAEVGNTLGAVDRLLAKVPLHRFEFTATAAAIDALHGVWGRA